MSEYVLAPVDAQEAAEIVRATRASSSLDIVGGGTKAGFGRPREGASKISTAKLTGLVFLEPAEMTLRARAGATMTEVEASLAQHNQMLPFEPVDLRGLMGSSGEPTIGGLVAAALSGPRRISAGAVRDGLIGLKFINGAGEILNSGGRVTKNVTGLDLVKIQCGAHGTLGLIVEATFKLLPKPRQEATIILTHLDHVGAVAAMTAALCSPFGISGAARLQEGQGRDFSRTLLRLEGFEDSVAYRVERLRSELARFGTPYVIDAADSRRLWRAVRDVDFLAEPRERAIWRVSVQPSHAPRWLARLGATALASILDWGGGLIWVATEPTLEAASAVRAATHGCCGHATLLRGDEAFREADGVFEPPTGFWLAQTKKLKATLDPDGVFNPGRMYEGV